MQISEIHIYIYIVNKFWDPNYAYCRTNYAKRTIWEFKYKIYLMQISEIHIYIYSHIVNNSWDPNYGYCRTKNAKRTI